MVYEPINQKQYGATYIFMFEVHSLSLFKTDEKWLAKILGQKAIKRCMKFGGRPSLV